MHTVGITSLIRADERTEGLSPIGNLKGFVFLLANQRPFVSSEMFKDTEPYLKPETTFDSNNPAINILHSRLRASFQQSYSGLCFGTQTTATSPEGNLALLPQHGT